MGRKSHLILICLIGCASISKFTVSADTDNDNVRAKPATTTARPGGGAGGGNGGGPGGGAGGGPGGGAGGGAGGGPGGGAGGGPGGPPTGGGGGPVTPGGSSPSRQQLPLWGANNTANGGSSRATNLQGIPLPSLTGSESVGPRGPILLQDFFLVEKLASFNRERIPERAIHAKGAGARGEFTVTSDISGFTKAAFLNGIGTVTPVFARFSTTFGSVGSADTAVDSHGFAVKFYTAEGNHDIVGTDVEVLPVRDPMLFPDWVRSSKRNPQTNLRDPNMWWDFTSSRPESTLFTLQLFSDLARSNGYRRMGGSSVSAYKLVNQNDVFVYAKFHWLPLQQGRPLTFQEAAELAGTNPDYFVADLYDAIGRGDFPVWTLYIQVMTPDQARRFQFNPFDPTRMWREEDFPMQPVGDLVLNTNPGNYFSEVEQSAFSMSNMVPGIEPSPDKVLTGGMFAHPDAARYRLGTNYPQLPINAPLATVSSYIRDGRACFGDNGDGSPVYYPNTFGGSFPDPEVAQLPFGVSGVVDRYDNPEDEFAQARLYLSLDVGPAERRRLVDGIADRLKDAVPQIRERVLKKNFYPISKEFGDEVRVAVNLAIANAKKLPPPPS